MSYETRATAVVAAIRNKINAMMPRLLPAGGTTGQVLSKSTGTDYATGWRDTVGDIIAYSVSLTLSTSWQDSTINAAELATGSHIVQIQVNDAGQGGGEVSEFYTGVMSWFAGDTNETTSDEIVLSRAGLSNGGNNIFVRVLRTVTADANDLKLQIAGTVNDTGASTVVFKFRKMI